MLVLEFQIQIVLGVPGGTSSGRKLLHTKKPMIIMAYLVFGILCVEHGMILLAILHMKQSLSLLVVLYRPLMKV